MSRQATWTSDTLSKLAIVHLCLLVSLVVAEAQCQNNYYNYNGTCNNIANPSWGKPDTPFTRIPLAANFSIDQSVLPSARDVSYRLSGLMGSEQANVTKPAEGSAVYNNKKRTHYTDMLTYLAQLVAHDIAWSRKNSTDRIGIPVPKCDLFFDSECTGNQTLPFQRSVATNATQSRETINGATSWVDLGVLYGDSPSVSERVRQKTGGLLLTDSGNLAYNKAPSIPTLENPLGLLNSELLRMAGDMRANQNPGLLSLLTVFMREHNRWATLFAQQHPNWDDNQLFEEARRWTIATWQKIVYYEYLPAVKVVLPPYETYKSDIDPRTDSFFTGAAYRYAHSEINDVVLRLNDDGTELDSGHLNLVNTFYNPESYLDEGIEPILRGLALGRQAVVRAQWNPALQHQYLAYPFKGTKAQDIISLDIQRSRDAGLPLYNDARRAFKLTPLVSWEAVTSDSFLQDTLRSLYGSPDNCDAYVCGMAEDKAPGSVHHGLLFKASITDQFQRNRDGDRFYFEAPGMFSNDNITFIKSRSLRDVIMQNSRSLINTLPINIYYHEDPSTPWPVPGMAPAVRGVNQTNCTALTLFGGVYNLTWEVVGSDILFRATVRMDKGWFGVGLAQAKDKAMWGADIILVQLDATAVVNDYYSPSNGKPLLDIARDGTNDVKLLRMANSGGVWTVEFQRPLVGNGKTDLSFNRAGATPIILAYNPGNPDLVAHTNDHSTQLLQDFFGCTTSSGGITAEHRLLRRHGILMAISFALVYQVGAVCARMIRATIITNNKVKHRMFYVHMFMQLIASAIATAAFIMVVRNGALTRKVGDKNLNGHGIVGCVVMGAVYFQIILGLIRPSADPKNPTAMRQLWGAVHMACGKAALYLGIFNMFLGIYLINRLYGERWNTWVALCASSLGVIFVCQQLFDGAERQKMTQELYRLTAGPGRPSTDNGHAMTKGEDHDDAYPAISLEQDSELEMNRYQQTPNTRQQSRGNEYAMRD